MIPEPILESHLSVHEEEKGKEAWKAEEICPKAPSVHSVVQKAVSS